MADVTPPQPVLEAGGVIQVAERHAWHGALLIVSEVRTWGVIAYLRMPSNDGTKGCAYIRLETGDYVAIGALAPMTREHLVGSGRAGAKVEEQVDA